MGCSTSCTSDSTCVRKVPIFQGMNDSELKSIQLVTKSREYKKSELIFHEGDQSHRLYVVNKGVIKIFKTSAEGKEQIVRLLFPGDFFGEFALLHEKEHYASAEALENTVICFIQKSDFLTTLEQSSGMSYRFILALNQLLHQADEWMSMLSLMEIEQRLARVLLLFYEKLNAKNGKYMLPVPKRDIASLIGTTPETLSRRLLAFSNRQLILLHGRKEIEITNFKQLATIARLEVS